MNPQETSVQIPPYVFDRTSPGSTPLSNGGTQYIPSLVSLPSSRALVPPSSGDKKYDTLLPHLSSSFSVDNSSKNLLNNTAFKYTDPGADVYMPSPENSLASFKFLDGMDSQAADGRSPSVLSTATLASYMSSSPGGSRVLRSSSYAEPGVMGSMYIDRPSSAMSAGSTFIDFPISRPSTAQGRPNSRSSFRRSSKSRSGRSSSRSGSTSSTTSHESLEQRRKYVCKICSRGFTTSGHLARHNRIHTGEKNHQCPFEGCQQRFSRQDNCLQHYRTHLKNAQANSLPYADGGDSNNFCVSRVPVGQGN